MRFSRYFEDTQTPEWKRSYLDYPKLRAELGIIRRKTLKQPFLVPNYLGENDTENKFFARTTGPLVSETKPPMDGTTGRSGRGLTSRRKPKTSKHKGSSVKYAIGAPITSPSPLYAILSSMPTTHAKFFDMLDAELSKVETFYIKKGEDMHERAKLLRAQLEGLDVHRDMFYESAVFSKPRNACLLILPTLSSMMQWFFNRNTKLVLPHQPRGNDINTPESEHDGKLATALPLKHGSGLPNLSFGLTKHVNPHEYQRAKGQLREAFVEHYHGLEILNNYRILNLTGFRNLLKKYEKIMKISILDVYMTEKIESSAFASGTIVTDMLKETEKLFAVRFGHKNRKKAIRHLRVVPSAHTYHSSVLRSGFWLGLALPAIAGGSYLSFQEQTRNSLPWDALLYIYSIFLLPILLAFLIGVNILVWARKRINYSLILDLQPKSMVDPHEYFELPSFLLCTLAYTFWFSLARFGPPTLWPLIWLAFALVVMLSPFRSYIWGSARWWTIKSLAKIWASAVLSVKFCDVWLGDQLCSLVYSFSGLYFVGCFYTRLPSIAFRSLLSSTYDLQAQEIWSTCSLAPNFGWYCFFGILPSMARFIQSLRLYWDSKFLPHLINAGKYGMSMVNYFCYCYWRYQANPHTGKSYILLCFVATANSIYGCSWDFLMDWAMMKPRARYPLLRTELVYKSLPCYYFALISNLCIRFLWVIYIFTNDPYMTQNTFIVAVLEVLRRVQWNFYRLEHNHLDNVRRHFATRRVPLPYRFEPQIGEKDGAPPIEEEMVEVDICRPIPETDV